MIGGAGGVAGDFFRSDIDLVVCAAWEELEKAHVIGGRIILRANISGRRNRQGRI